MTLQEENHMLIEELKTMLIKVEKLKTPKNEQLNQYHCDVYSCNRLSMQQFSPLDIFWWFYSR